MQKNIINKKEESYYKEEVTTCAYFTEERSKI